MSVSFFEGEILYEETESVFTTSKKKKATFYMVSCLKYEFITTGVFHPSLIWIQILFQLLSTSTQIVV